MFVKNSMFRECVAMEIFSFMLKKKKKIGNKFLKPCNTRM